MQRRVSAAFGSICGADILRIRSYLGRGVSHTPYERFRRKRRDTPRHKNNHSPPPAASGGRMRYAPTPPDNREHKTKYKKGIPITSKFQKLVCIRVGAYRIRPPNVSEGNEETRQGTKTIIRCLRQRLGGVFDTPLPHRTIGNRKPNTKKEFRSHRNSRN